MSKQRTSQPGKGGSASDESPWRAFREGAVGTIGALLITFAIAWLLASLLVWMAGRFFSIGIGSSPTMVLVIAALLTGLFYWYDRNNR